MKRASFSASVKGPRCCVCGKCVGCVDNARWERIFQENFGQQERDYYAERREPRSFGVSARAFADASVYAYTDEQQPSEAKNPIESNLKRLQTLLHTARYMDKIA